MTAAPPSLEPDFERADDAAEAWKDFHNGFATNTPAKALGNLARAYLAMRRAPSAEARRIEKLEQAVLRLLQPSMLALPGGGWTVNQAQLEIDRDYARAALRGEP